ncbi:hypothetical protein NEF87_003779 [Candidatus Lokiarchaeum ossiferum]|uniref:Uncharacterized protein n=1 Tax=Candidatus Lokiarchaeum ossiferum TaxID=2951803 RepID=A0ABY6HY67_9ARCH|nr:hypothetical protein NEF87_003779 [Candidatus Lokiarchaeum sp. B-35]
MSSNPLIIDIPDPIIKRNYNLIRHYLINLLDSGLDFLRRIYVKENSDSSFLEFTANNYYDYILKDYIRRKGKTQIRIVLNSAVECLNHIEDDLIDPDFLDEKVKKTFAEYANVDWSLKHTSSSHPIRSELELISRLTYRISIIQATRFINCNEPDVKFVSELIRKKYATKELCQEALDAVLSIFDQMIDCFERNLDAINIPFYKPTWNIRDWKYMRRLYEFALELMDNELSKIYTGENF